MKCDKKIMLLYAVTDRSWTGEMSLYDQVEAALKGGVTCVQLREKNLNQNDFLAEAIQIREICKKYQIPFIINDNVSIAIACKADGVHIGQDDMTASQARSLIGDKMMLGVSVHNVKEAVEAVKNGADHLGVGAVFSTSTKSDASVLSHDTVKDICDSVTVPVVAIGGINKHNLSQLKGSGVDGVALISSIFSVSDIENECKILKNISLEMVQ